MRLDEPFHPMAIDSGGGRQVHQKFGVEGTLILMSRAQSFCLLRAFLHVIYNVIIAFSPTSEAYAYYQSRTESGPGYSSAFGLGPPNFAVDRRYRIHQ